MKASRLISRHKGTDGIGKSTDFEMNEESDGTRRLLDLVPAMISLMSGGIV